MKHSETVGKVAAALCKAQPKVGIALKNAVNPHLRNKYADIGAVWDAISSALEQHGLAVTQMPSPSDDGKLHLTTTLWHESGEYMSSTMVMPISKQDPQGYGSALTYARRYSLAALMGVTQDDDDGARAVASEKRSEAQQAVERINECQTLADLQTVFTEAYQAVKGNKEAADMVIAAKDAKKKELSNG